MKTGRTRQLHPSAHPGSRRHLLPWASVRILSVLLTVAIPCWGAQEARPWWRYKVVLEMPQGALAEAESVLNSAIVIAGPEGYVAKDKGSETYFFRVGDLAGNARDGLLSYGPRSKPLDLDDPLGSWYDPIRYHLFPQFSSREGEHWEVMIRPDSSKDWLQWSREPGTLFWPPGHEALVRRTGEDFPRRSEWHLQDFAVAAGGASIPTFVELRASVDMTDPGRMSGHARWHLTVLPGDAAAPRMEDVLQGRLIDPERGRIKRFAVHRFPSAAEPIRSVAETSQTRAKGATRPSWLTQDQLRYWPLLLTGIVMTVAVILHRFRRRSPPS